jgi:hypothetical protein
MYFQWLSVEFNIAQKNIIKVAFSAAEGVLSLSTIPNYFK